jgi:hypothetical protein
MPGGEMPGEGETVTRFSAPVNVVMQLSWFHYQFVWRRLLGPNSAHSRRFVIEPSCARA